MMFKQFLRYIFIGLLLLFSRQLIADELFIVMAKDSPVIKMDKKTLKVGATSQLLQKKLQQCCNENAKNI